MLKPKQEKKKYIEPKYTMLAQANAARNNYMGVDTNKPATAKDSLDYKHGFNLGLKGGNLDKFESNEFSRKGMWEGKNSEHAFKNKDAAIIAKKIGK